MNNDFIKDKKIAIVCDWLIDWWGAELVLEHMLEIFPQADIFASINFAKHKILKKHKIKTSFIQNIPILNKKHKLAWIFRPLAFENFDLSKYDIVISSSSAESKWVITKPETLHICYCHTPTRYYWSHYQEYLNMWEFWILNSIIKALAPWRIHKLRQWDFLAAQRPDIFLSNSNNTWNRVKKYYKREVQTLYPWVPIDHIEFNSNKKDFYLAVWRTIPYKKFDLIIDAFNENWKRLICVTNTDNKLFRDLKNKSKSNITWKLNLERSKTLELFNQAKGFIFPPDEDFWLVPLEAQAWGTPVIAYWKWWSLETVIDWVTWVFFKKQTVKSLNKAINKFESIDFDYSKSRENAIKFSKEIFQEWLLSVIKKNLKN